jgi:hypothetical protein
MAWAARAKPADGEYDFLRVPKQLPMDGALVGLQERARDGDAIQIDVIRRRSVDQSKLNMDNENVRVKQMAKIFRI